MVDLLARDRVAVVRHPGDLFSHPFFELAGDDLTSLAWMTRTSGTAWRDGEVHYAVAYDDGRPLWTVVQHSTPTVSRFEVTAASGEWLGRIDQENALFAPRLAITDPDENTIRLEGSRTAPRAWQLQDLAGQPLGRGGAQRPRGAYGAAAGETLRGRAG